MADADAPKKPAPPKAPAPAGGGIGARLLPYALVWIVMIYGRDLLAGSPPAPAKPAPPAAAGAAFAGDAGGPAARGRGLAGADRDAADEEFAEFAPPAAAAKRAAPAAGGARANGDAEVLVKLCTS